MKKLFLFAAIFAATSIQAKVITLPLNTAESIAYETCSASPSVVNDELTINYTAGAWMWAGVEFPLNNLEVTSVDFEYKGVTQDWTSFVVYLRAEDGARWYDDADDFSMSHADWFAKTGYFPTKLMWDESEYELGEKPFIALGLIANPITAGSGVFSLRNVKITVPDDATGINNTVVEGKTMKVIRDGQVLILRDGKAYNALGVEMK